MTDLCGPVLKDRHLVLDLCQLLLERLHPFKVETSTTIIREVRRINLRRPWKLTLYHDLEVGSRILHLLFGDLQLLL
jgi:hypothetical protein